jgi:hypothetical protein
MAFAWAWIHSVPSWPALAGPEEEDDDDEEEEEEASGMSKSRSITIVIASGSCSF